QNQPREPRDARHGPRSAVVGYRQTPPAGARTGGEVTGARPRSPEDRKEPRPGNLNRKAASVRPAAINAFSPRPSRQARGTVLRGPPPDTRNPAPRPRGRPPPRIPPFRPGSSRYTGEGDWGRR